MTHSGSVCRWGILGTAGIARKNWRAAGQTGNAVVTAVSSRTLESAQRFIDECSLDVRFDRPVTALAPYEALLERDDVDAIYVPLPTAMRKDWVIRAAEAGKHVLAEKPAASNASEVREMLAACEQHGVQYMDGVMFMHSSRLPLIRSLLNDPNKVGRVRRLASQFSFCGDEAFRTQNIRTDSRLEPHGCLGDLGWYCIRFFLWAMQGQMPTAVRARTLSTLQGVTSPDPVPGEFSAELVFPGGVTASFYNSFVTENQQWVNISGEKGYLTIDDFVLPFHGAESAVEVHNHSFFVQNTNFHMRRHSQRSAAREFSSGLVDAQEVQLIREFSRIVVSGKLDPQWPTWTLNTQLVLDACWESAKRNGAEVTL
ncbi:MAG: Gfo/Idh/MocA family oxidoreductase [Pirellulales bacterium]